MLRTKKKKKIKNKIERLIKKYPFLDQNHQDYASSDLSSKITAQLTVDEIKLLKNEDDIISGIELYKEPKEEISEAMLSTKVDPYAFSLTNKGSGIGVYFTEPGCPDNGFMDKYYKVNSISTPHCEWVAGVLRAVSPDCYMRCKSTFRGYVLPDNDDINGCIFFNGGDDCWNPHDSIYIVSQSAGTFYEGSYKIVDRNYDDFVYDNGIPVFKSAGNEGSATGYLTSPGQGLNVISVGNYNDATNTIHYKSSYKNPETGNDKPELCAPGTNITAGGHTDETGTSAAAPHAAAFAADLMSSYSFLKLRPYYLKAFLMSGATKEISGGYDKVGIGGMDFYRTYFNVAGKRWEGSNSSYSTFDSQDPDPNNGIIEYTTFISANFDNVRIVLSWLNRGSYVYDH